LSGVVVAYVFYMVAPSIPAAIAKALSPVIRVLENKYYLDWFNENVLSRGARLLGTGLWKGGDQGLIDGLLINGSARLVGLLAGASRLVQTGHIYWYALVMLLGLFGFLSWQLWPAVLGPFMSGLSGH
jgi:NADH-quinone oxidoreductase subunit L